MEKALISQQIIKGLGNARFGKQYICIIANPEGFYHHFIIRAMPLKIEEPKEWLKSQMLEGLKPKAVLAYKYSEHWEKQTPEQRECWLNNLEAEDDLLTLLRAINPEGFLELHFIDKKGISDNYIYKVIWDNNTQLTEEWVLGKKSEITSIKLK